MAKKELAHDKLASELFADITRAELALKFRPQVIAPLMEIPGYQNQCNSVIHHMFTATVTLLFMTISRLFDPPHGRLSVTLEDLVDRVEKEKATSHFGIWREAAAFRKTIKGVRSSLAKARGNIFAHRSYLEKVPKVVWADLENAHAVAVKILAWYGWYYGHAYSFLVSGYAEDCDRFIAAQKSIKWVP